MEKAGEYTKRRRKRKDVDGQAARNPEEVDDL
jgi:hypothetical protein